MLLEYKKGLWQLNQLILVLLWDSRPAGIKWLDRDGVLYYWYCFISIADQLYKIWTELLFHLICHQQYVQPSLWPKNCIIAHWSNVRHKVQIASLQQMLSIRLLTKKVKAGVETLKNLHCLSVYVIEYKSLLLKIRVQMCLACNICT